MLIFVAELTNFDGSETEYRQFGDSEEKRVKNQLVETIGGPFRSGTLIKFKIYLWYQ